MVYFITSILIPSVVLLGLMYVVYHQYGEMKYKSEKRKNKN